MAVRVRNAAWRRVAVAGVSLIAMTHGVAARETVLSLVPLCDEDGIEVLPGAAPERVRVSIAPGPLEPALAVLAEQTGLKLAYRTAMTQGLTTRGAEGELRPRDALARTLEGTGLSCRSAGSSTITLENPRYVQLGGAASEATLEEIAVEGSGNGARSGGQPPPTGTVGQPPPAYAGGQVASGARLGILGNRSVFDTPFTQNNYTEQLIRDQQALTVSTVFDNNPSVRQVTSPFGVQPAVFIRGFLLDSREFAFDGLYGLTSFYRPAIEGIERIEILSGPGAFLYGFPPSGNIGGVVNFTPKRAPEQPLTRVTGQYLSNANLGGTVDVARRFGEGNALGMRIIGAYRDGPTPIDRNDERFGVLSLGLDYRGDRLRLSADFGYQSFSNRAVPFGFSVLPGFAIPRAPSLTSNVQQPWERTDTSHAFTVGRAEYDVTDDVTAFGAIGGSTNKNALIYTAPTITDAAGTVRQDATRYVEEVQQWTAEAGIRARFSTGFIDHSAAIVGTHYESYRPFGFFFGPSFISNLYAPVLVPQPVFPSEASIPRTIAASALDSIAVTDTMSIFDGRVQVIAGGRFQRAQRSTTSPVGAVTGRYDETAATPLAAMIVKPLQNLSLYASYAEGFGFGPQPPVNALNANAVFPPVISTQIETGAKLDLGTLGATIAF